jgi:hypothetical protein
MPQPIITIFYLDAAQPDPLVILQATSKRFTEMGWMPQIGARIVLQQTDLDLLAPRRAVGKPDELESILANSESAGAGGIMMIVREVIYDFLLSDIGILCDYRPPIVVHPIVI